MYVQSLPFWRTVGPFTSVYHLWLARARIGSVAPQFFASFVGGFPRGSALKSDPQTVNTR
jgi:hypothetical protein